MSWKKERTVMVLLMRRAPENSASSTVISFASVVCLSALARASPYRFPSLCAACLTVAAVRRHGLVLLRSMVLRGKRSELEKPPSALNLRIRVCPYRKTRRNYIAALLRWLCSPESQSIARSSSVIQQPRKAGTFITNQTCKGKPFHRGSSLPSSFSAGEGSAVGRATISAAFPRRDTISTASTALQYGRAHL